MVNSASTGLSISLTEPVLFLRAGNELENRGRTNRSRTETARLAAAGGGGAHSTIADEGARSRPPSRSGPPGSPVLGPPGPSSARNSTNGVSSLANTPSATSNPASPRSSTHPYRRSGGYGVFHGVFRSHDESRPHSPIEGDDDHHHHSNHHGHHHNHQRSSQEEALRQEIEDLHTYAPTVLRGLVVLHLSKPSRIRKISVRLKGVSKTEWPEGIGSRRLDMSEEHTLIDETHVFFSAKDLERPGFRRVNSLGSVAHQNNTVSSRQSSTSELRRDMGTAAEARRSLILRSNSEKLFPNNQSNPVPMSRQGSEENHYPQATSSPNIAQQDVDNNNFVDPPIPSYEDSENQAAEMMASSPISDHPLASTSSYTHYHNQNNGPYHLVHNPMGSQSDRMVYRPFHPHSATPSRPSTPEAAEESVISLPHTRRDFIHGFSSVEHSPSATPSASFSPDASPFNSVFSLDQFAHDVASAPPTALASTEDYHTNNHSNPNPPSALSTISAASRGSQMTDYFAPVRTSSTSRFRLNSLSSALRRKKSKSSTHSNDQRSSLPTSPFMSPLSPSLNSGVPSPSSSKHRDRPSGLKALRHALLTGIHPHESNDTDSHHHHEPGETDEDELHHHHHDHHRWKEFPAGTYTYPVSFSLPPTLPPSIKCDCGYTTYTLKAYVHRAGVLTSNLTSETDVNLITCPGDDDLEETHSILVERYWGTQLRYVVVLSGKSFPLGGRLPISIRLDPLDKVKVYRISALLEEKISYYTQDQKSVRHEGIRKYQLLRVENEDLTEPMLPITSTAPDAIENSPLASLFVRGNGKEEAIPALTDPYGPWELETTLKIPDNRSRLKFSCTHDKSAIGVTHDLKIIIRVERGDEEQVDRSGRKKKFDIIIQTPVQLLSSECALNRLPRYTSMASGWMARAPDLERPMTSNMGAHSELPYPTNDAFNTPLVLTAPPSPLLRPEQTPSYNDSMAPSSFSLVMSNNNQDVSSSSGGGGDGTPGSHDGSRSGGTVTPTFLQGGHASSMTALTAATPVSLGVGGANTSATASSSTPALSTSAADDIPANVEALQQARRYAALVEGRETETGVAPPSYEMATHIDPADGSRNEGDENGVRTYVGES